MKRLTVNAVIQSGRMQELCTQMDALELAKDDLAQQVSRELMQEFIKTERHEDGHGYHTVSVRLDVIVATPEEFRRAVHDEAMKYGFVQFMNDAQASITDYYPDAMGVKKIWEDLK